MHLFSLKRLESDQATVLLPKSFYSKQATRKKIAFGSTIYDCIFKLTNEENTIFISDMLWEQLAIPYMNMIHAFENDGIIHIGPLIGIFTAGFTGSNLRPIGDRSLFFAKLLSAEKTAGAYTFVFGAHHINWKAGTIKGLFHREKGWEQHEVPFPNAIYDRLPNRKTENQLQLKSIKTQLQSEYLIPWFNSGFFNKWEIHQIFLKHQIKHYLPETVAHPTFDTIELFLKKYQSIYMKPTNGSLGLGIRQIIHPLDSNEYYCRFRINEQNFLRKYTSLEKLLMHLFPDSEFDNYIVQQGISLIRHKSRPIDFRVHTNKDEGGQWKMSAIAAKIAGPGSVTTHLGSGGSVLSIEELSKITPLPPDCVQKVEKVVLKMSSILENELQGIIGEIGFDLGIDKDGEIWVFEANSKPGRSIFNHPDLIYYDQLSNLLPLSFAVYLSKKFIIDPGVLYHEKA